MGADALQIVKRTLGGLSVIVNALPIPDPFKSAVVGIPDAVLQIITILEANSAYEQTAKGNMEDAIALTVYIATVTDKTIRPLDPINTAPAAMERIEEFFEVLQQIKKGVRDLASHKSRWRRIVNYDRDASTLAAMKQSVADAITSIQLETAVATNQEVDLISRKQDVMSQEQGLISWKLDRAHDAQHLMSQKQDQSLREIKALVQEQEALYHGQQIIIRQQQPLCTTEIARLIASLGAKDSGSSKKPPCMEGTRVSLLDRINQWIENRPDHGPRALCLKGSAGIGKSSIGATIARELRASHRLGAEFYFIASQQERNEAVVVVLARQLASWSKGKLRFEIAGAIDDDAEIMRRTPEVQFQQLIQGPLETLTGDLDSSTLVMLLDGLDECDEEYACRLLTAVGEGLSKLPVAVRVVLTSRPEPHLLAVYASEPMRSQLEIYYLDTEEVLQLKMDIWKYFKEELPGMVKRWVKDSADWPGEERRAMLVELSQGLFIHATTVARMLSDSTIRNPEKQLEAVLASHRDTDRHYGRNTHLDSIYSSILNRACPPNSTSDLVDLFRNVLGTILVVQVPVNIHTLASLLCPHGSGLEDYIHSIRTTVLAYLQAVLVVPGVEDADPSRNALQIRIIHKSFEDYLTDKSRCEPRLLLDIPHFNRNMTVRCLTFPGLKRNICDLDPSRLNSEVDAVLGSDIDAGVMAEEDDEEQDEEQAGEEQIMETKDQDREVEGFERRVQDHVSAGLQYACEHWPKHVSREPPESDGVKLLLKAFLQTHLLHWVEVVSLLEKMEELIGWIEMVESWLKADPTPEPLLSSAVHWLEMLPINAYRRLQERIVHAASYSTFLHTNNRIHGFDVNLESPEQAASPTSRLPRPPVLPSESRPPIATLLRELKYFVREFMVPISTSSSHIYYSAIPFTPRQSPLSVTYGHLSEGGPRVHRGQLQQWSNPEDHCLEDDADEDEFSMWDTSAPIRDRFIGHRADVICAAWSPNGEMIVSGSEDKTLRIWSPSTGRPIGKPLQGHTHRVHDTAWSPDGKRIVSVSRDGTLRFWSASTGACIGEPLLGHDTQKVWCTAWSPDGRMIVSGARDATLRRWSASAQAPIGGPLEGHERGVLCAAWSPDSKTIVSGSMDATLRFWSASTGAPIGAPMKGHEDEVHCTAWSPDGKTIASGSADATLRFWSASTGASIGESLKGHEGAVTCIAWSPNGETIVSGSVDETLRFWNVSTGTPVGEPSKGYEGGVSCVAWSPNGKTIVVGCGDGAFHLCDATTGEPIRFGPRWPDSHTHSVYRLAFSPNSRYIVSASADNTLCLWDTKTGTLARKPVSQLRKISSLEFSLDGKYVLLEDDEVRTVWDIAGEGDELGAVPTTGPATEDHVSVLTIDDDGWLWSAEGKRMFWVPVVLRPTKQWGRVLVKGKILAMETQTVPIIDISSYVSKGL
ncbi:hypothetical protein FRB97_001067 [Tulasnella sp. 331]|nr:hypothetical protein FRB97_001067 [Tulasnella sp. 331]